MLFGHAPLFGRVEEFEDVPPQERAVLPPQHLEEAVSLTQILLVRDVSRDLLDLSKALMRGFRERGHATETPALVRHPASGTT